VGAGGLYVAVVKVTFRDYTLLLLFEVWERRERERERERDEGDRGIIKMA